MAIKRILVPTDFSDASRDALRYACDLAGALGASISIIHAIENQYLPGGYMEFYVPPADHFDRLEQESRKALESMLTAEDLRRYHVTLVQVTGAAAHEILNYLDEQGDIDLVVMATHGRGGVARLMMGSVTDKLVRAAPCPVLTIRPALKPAGRTVPVSVTSGMLASTDPAMVK